MVTSYKALAFTAPHCAY
uniref:Uncharacterized protein n=1 Tax=Anguilla anguilla TaxID=7936 RepID=A0A0E9VFQ1_ANGAN